MRLICPNCSAEYEVEPSVIPPEGRDVQCSNCNKTWFERGPADGASVSAPPAPAPRNERSRLPRATRHPTTTQNPVDEPAPGPSGPAMSQARKPVDDEVLRVLRSEAEHEQRIRRGEPVDPFQDQSELALAGAAPRQSRRVPTNPRDLPDEDLVPSGTIGRRRSGDAGRNVLPDIEEINSTLRASAERPNSVPAYVEVERTLRKLRRAQGFRFGFSAIMAAVSVALFVYVFEDELSDRWPQTAPYIEEFVDTTNHLRAMLDTVIGNVSTRLSTLITENTG